MLKFAEDFAVEHFKINPTEAIAQGVCIQCKQPALEHCHTDAGIREFQQSGLCEDCFDSMFEESS